MKILEKIFLGVGVILTIASLTLAGAGVIAKNQDWVNRYGTYRPAHSTLVQAQETVALLLVIALSFAPLLTTIYFVQISKTLKTQFQRYFFGLLLTGFYIAWVIFLSFSYIENIAYRHQCYDFCGLGTLLFGFAVLVALIPMTAIAIATNMFPTKKRIIVTVGISLWVVVSIIINLLMGDT